MLGILILVYTLIKESFLVLLNFIESDCYLYLILCICKNDNNIKNNNDIRNDYTKKKDSLIFNLIMLLWYSFANNKVNSINRNVIYQLILHLEESKISLCI